MTLDEIFPNGRGDGRKFTTRHDTQPYEPIIKCKSCEDDRTYWYVQCDNDVLLSYCQSEVDTIQWIEWHPPKKTKKVKMYRPIFKNAYDQFFIDQPWVSYKLHSYPRDIPIIGWQEMEIEVEYE